MGKIGILDLGGNYMKTKLSSLFRISMVAVIFFIIASSYSVSNATSKLHQMQDDIDKFKNIGEGTHINTANVTDEIKGIGQILTFVGTGIFVGVVAYMGIKYLTAGPEAQAKLKIQLIGVVVSGVVIFGAYNIWSIVIDVLKDA